MSTVIQWLCVAGTYHLLLITYNLYSCHFLSLCADATTLSINAITADTIFYTGKIKLFFGRGSAVYPCAQGKCKIAVDIAKCFQVAFGVAAGCAATLQCIAAQPVAVVTTGTQYLCGRVQPFYQQGIGFMLCPLKAAFLPVHPNFQGIFFAGRHLRCHQHTRQRHCRISATRCHHHPAHGPVP